jgi:hypothetical protein
MSSKQMEQQSRPKEAEALVALIGRQLSVIIVRALSTMLLIILLAKLLNERVTGMQLLCCNYGECGLLNKKINFIFIKINNK